jgi:hypothetical protein
VLQAGPQVSQVNWSHWVRQVWQVLLPGQVPHWVLQVWQVLPGQVPHWVLQVQVGQAAQWVSQAVAAWAATSVLGTGLDSRISRSNSSTGRGILTWVYHMGASRFMATREASNPIKGGWSGRIGSRYT